MKSNYQDQLNEFSSLVRNPKLINPVNKRIGLYHDLVVANLDSVISPCFPVLKSILPDHLWRMLIVDFLSTKRATTPLFYKLPRVFVGFLKEKTLLAYPFAYELAHYEWIELEVELQECPLHEIQGDLDYPINLFYFERSNWARILSYQYDVHSIGREYLPLEQKPTYLIVYAKKQQVKFIKISEISYTLLNYMLNEQISAYQVIEQLQQTQANIDKAFLSAGMGRLLNDLYREGIIILLKKDINHAI